MEIKSDTELKIQHLERAHEGDIHFTDSFRVIDIFSKFV